MPNGNGEFKDDAALRDVHVNVGAAVKQPKSSEYVFSSTVSPI